MIRPPGGTTHAGSLLSGNACEDDVVAAYLADGTLPPRLAGNRADILCAPLPQPVPDGASASTANRAAAGLATPRAPGGLPLVLRG